MQVPIKVIKDAICAAFDIPDIKTYKSKKEGVAVKAMFSFLCRKEKYKYREITEHIDIQYASVNYYLTIHKNGHIFRRTDFFPQYEERLRFVELTLQTWREESIVKRVVETWSVQ